MESKFSALISNIKNINSASIVDTFKKNQENLHPKAVLQFARKAVDSARSFSKDEINVLLGKANELGQKTNTEIEKIVSSAVKNILKGQPQDQATDEVRIEITKMLVEHNNGKNLLPIVKYVNSVLLNNAPTSLEAFKNFKKNIGQTLISDAQKRISDRNIIDAQVIPEKKTQKKRA